jgi:hypothetical protein
MKLEIRDGYTLFGIREKILGGIEFIVLLIIMEQILYTNIKENRNARIF